MAEDNKDISPLSSLGGTYIFSQSLGQQPEECGGEDLVRSIEQLSSDGGKFWMLLVSACKLKIKTRKSPETE